MGTFEAWREADEAWVSSNIEVLREDFLAFYQTGEWPEVRVLQRGRDIAGKHAPTVADIALAKPPIPGLGNFIANPPRSLILNTYHLIALSIPEAWNLLEAIVTSCVVAIGAYKNLKRDFPIKFTDKEVSSRWPLLNPCALNLVPRFVLSDFPTPFSGGGWGDTEWSLGVSESYVMQFGEVSRTNEYADRQLSIIKTLCDKRDQGQANVKANGPLKVFLAMPFGRPWSDATHQALVRIVREVDSSIDLRRLDQLNIPGRITEQLVAELQQADFLIADVTDGNANVSWELGYAEALGKQSVIIRRSDDLGTTPFDIYDRRWVTYDDPFTPQQINALKGHVQNAAKDAR